MKFRGECYLLMTLISINIFTCAEEVKLTVASIDSPLGLYFEEIGQLFFYTTQWEVASYVNLKPSQLVWKQVKAHQLQIVNYCVKIHNTT